MTSKTLTLSRAGLSSRKKGTAIFKNGFSWERSSCSFSFNSSGTSPSSPKLFFDAGRAVVIKRGGLSDGIIARRAAIEEKDTK